LYVANINENPWQKDNNGYISKITLDGKMIAARWATGLSAPKGMGISNGKLYVTDIDEVAEIDLVTGSVLQRLTNPRAVNLNDIAVSREGTVYVSDSKGDCLYQIKDGKLEVLSDSPEVKASNGLFVKNGLLLCGQQNRVAALNLKTKEVSTFIANTGGIDGIEAVGNKTYLISDWSGHVYMVEPDNERMLLLDTTPLKINAADIGYNKSEGILYVPTFFNNGVVAYKLD
jgi:outer membrane protein assembly factor BamB